MNRSHILTVAFISFIVISCSKTMKVENVTFGVSTSSNTYHVGDTVHFDFKGQPDIITFYSGETGNAYENRDRTIAKGKAEMQFTTWARYGTQKNTLHLLISSDFDGNYDSASIHNATWTDITDKAVLSTGDQDTHSGVIDLSSYTEEGKPFYFAFKYTGTSGSTQKKWYISDFQINLLLEDSSVTAVANMVTAGWNVVYVLGEPKQFDVGTDQIVIAGGPAAFPDNEDWLITTSLNPNKVTPDRAVPIKDISQRMEGFDYIYTKPGNYKVVFKAINATGDEVSSVMKTVNITVE